MTKIIIRKHDTIVIKKEYEDEGDSDLHWVAIEDEAGGRVKAIPIDTGLNIPPVYVFHTYMLEGF